MKFKQHFKTINILQIKYKKMKISTFIFSRN